jgi:hypothetical protein
VSDEVIAERPAGRLAGGELAASPWTIAAVAAIPAVVLVLLVALKVRRALRERRGPVSSRRISLRPPPGPGA